MLEGRGHDLCVDCAERFAGRPVPGLGAVFADDEVERGAHGVVMRAGELVVDMAVGHGPERGD